MANIETRIEAMQKQLDELKAELKKKEDAEGLWYPKDEVHFNVCWDGKAYAHEGYFHDAAEFENIFKTKEQAERHAKRLKLYNKLWRLAEHLNGEWTFDLRAENSAFHTIHSCQGVKDLGVSSSIGYKELAPVFKTKELAEKAISMLTEEEKEIFKNIYRP